jgi:hypothetical protein
VRLKSPYKINSVTKNKISFNISNFGSAGCCLGAMGGEKKELKRFVKRGHALPWGFPGG